MLEPDSGRKKRPSGIFIEESASDWLSDTKLNEKNNSIWIFFHCPESMPDSGTLESGRDSRRLGTSSWIFGDWSCDMFCKGRKSVRSATVFDSAGCISWFSLVKHFAAFRFSISCSYSSILLQDLPVFLLFCFCFLSDGGPLRREDFGAGSNAVVVISRRFFIVFMDLFKSNEFKSAFVSASLKCTHFLSWLFAILIAAAIKIRSIAKKRLGSRPEGAVFVLLFGVFMNGVL